MKNKSFTCILILIFTYTPAVAGVFDVTNLSDAWSAPFATNSLAWALQQANATAGPHTIRLMVAGTVTGSNPANYTITQNNVTIDGTYAPGYISGGGPKFFLKGPAYNTFSIPASNATIIAFGMSSFSFNVTGSNFTIYSSWLGLTSTGALDATAPGPSYGITVTGGNAVIGHNNTFRNVISYSGVTNALIVSGNGNSLVGNYFMTEPTGTTVIGTVGSTITGSTILVQGNNNVIDSNVVVGSCGGGNFGGIAVNGASTNLNIRYNFIGVNKNGVFAYGGTGSPYYGNNGHGIYVGSSISSSYITGNVISSNRQSGVSIEQTNTSLTINNNIVGLPGSGVQGAVQYGNGDSGIRFFAAGTSTSSLVDNNTVCNSGLINSANSQSATTGIIYNGVTVASATISNNYTGIDRSFNLAGNQFPGVYFFGCGNMGGSNVNNVLVTNNVVGNNGLYTNPPSNGVSSYSSHYFTISGNYIGIGPGGQSIGNVANGIEINTCNNFVIKNNNIQKNLGKRTSAVAEACGGIVCFASTLGTIQGNTISYHSNAGGGFVNNNGIVVQQGSQIMIGGTAAGQPNSITNNGTHGVHVLDNANFVQMTRNIIECNASMGISLNVAGDPNTVGTKSTGNSAMTTGPTLALPGSGCPGTGGTSSSGPVTFTGNAGQANANVEVFQNPQNCRDCATQGLRRGEGAAYITTVSADGAGNFTYGPVVYSGDIAVTATSITSCSGAFCSTSRFSACSTCSLPLKWYSIEAIRESLSAKIKWSTVSEENTSYFIVERSMDGRLFLPVSGHIKGAGNSMDIRNYECIDPILPTGTIYYRILEVDMNGIENYSGVIYLEQTESAHITIAPNPTHGKFVILSDAENEYYYEIMNSMGQSISSGTNRGKENRIDLSAYSRGVYIVKIVTEDQEEFVRLVVE
jgi:hypothetical protein